MGILGPTWGGLWAGLWAGLRAGCSASSAQGSKVRRAQHSGGLSVLYRTVGVNSEVLIICSDYKALFPKFGSISRDKINHVISGDLENPIQPRRAAQQVVSMIT